MTETVRTATTITELVEAVQAAECATIEVRGRLEGAPSLRLQPGQRLRGAAGAAIRFEPKSDGIILTTNNTVEEIELHTDPKHRALYNDTAAEGFGRLTLRHLRTTGCIRLIAAGAASGGHVDARDLYVIEADVRDSDERSVGFGVEVIPGVFTLWNRHSSPNHRVSAELLGIAAGRAGLPVRGTGVSLGERSGAEKCRSTSLRLAGSTVMAALPLAQQIGSLVESLSFRGPMWMRFATSVKLPLMAPTTWPSTTGDGWSGGMHMAR